jgi:hypothetical protein
VRTRFTLVAAVVVPLIIAAPAAAHVPLDFTEDATSVVCEAVTDEAGAVRLTASVSSLSGPAGFLLFWAAPADPAFVPPTLVSMGMDASIGADGSLTATYDMFTPGDLGITAGEPVFVGIAELTTTLSPIGQALVIDEVTRNGNSQFRIQGTSQPLAVAGSLTVPTAGTFELAGCVGEREILAFFGTQPDADVSTIDRTRVECFWGTDDGFVALEAQADEDDVFVQVLVIDGSGAHFGLTVPSLSPDGIDATVLLDPTGSATISAEFASIERIKFKDKSENHWVMVTLDLLAVDGTISIETPGGQQALAMDDASCLADSRKVISLTTTPGG